MLKIWTIGESEGGRHDRGDQPVDPAVLAGAELALGTWNHFDSLRSDLEHPGEDDRDRETGEEQQGREADRPGRESERREDGVDDLEHQPAGDRVGAGDPHDAALLELVQNRRNRRPLHAP
jgi:hypothetical protein